MLGNDQIVDQAGGPKIDGQGDEPAGPGVRGRFERPGVHNLHVVDVGRRLAAGEASVVYEAADISLGRKVALKCIRDAVFLDPPKREAFLQAARAAEQLAQLESGTR